MVTHDGFMGIGFIKEKDTGKIHLALKEEDGWYSYIQNNSLWKARKQGGNTTFYPTLEEATKTEEENIIDKLSKLAAENVELKNKLKHHRIPHNGSEDEL